MIAGKERDRTQTLEETFHETHPQNHCRIYYSRQPN